MPIDAKIAFNIAADGSDETAKITAALAAAGDTGTGDEVIFPPGMYGVNGMPPITANVVFRGVGPEKTFFKNLSASQPAFDLVRQAPGVLNSSFSKIGGFTVLQNGCVGDAIRMNAQYSGIDDVVVWGQGGAGFAYRLEGATEATMERCHSFGGTNGLKAKDTHYFNLSACTIERTNGRGVDLEGCAVAELGGLYLDNGSSPTGYSDELFRAKDCRTVLLPGLSCEIGPGATLTPNQYFSVIDTDNLVFSGARFSHYSGDTMHYVTYFDNSGVSMNDVEYVDCSPMVFVGGKGAQSRLSVRRVTTNITHSGSRYGVALWDGAIGRITMEDWFDKFQPAPHVIHAADLRLVQIEPSVSITAGSGSGVMRTIQNCPTVSG